jgi:hypothetical protein
LFKFKLKIATVSTLIDYVKIRNNYVNKRHLLHNSGLEFTYDNVNTETGEIKLINSKGQKVTPHQKAEYKGLKFKVYDTGTVLIQGSLHKYYNDGKHNYNDFGENEVNEVVKEIDERFKINPNYSVLQNIELGVNLTDLPTQTNEVISSSLLHKTHLLRGDHNEKKYEHSQYTPKLYDKRLDALKDGYKLDKDILRYEVKYNKMEKFNHKGIHTMQDLLNYGLNNFKEPLLKEWNNILYYDNTIKSDHHKLPYFSNSKHWTDLLKNGQRSLFYKDKKLLKEITERHSNRIQHQISKLIGEKINELTKYTN